MHIAHELPINWIGIKCMSKQTILTIERPGITVAYVGCESILVCSEPNHTVQCAHGVHPRYNWIVSTLTILSKVNDYVSIFCIICQLLESNISNFFPYSESITKCLFSQFRRHIRRITHNRPCNGLILGRIWPFVLTRVNSITSWTRFETITT